MRTLLTVAIVVGLALTGAAVAGEHPEHPKAKAEAASTEKVALDGKVFVGMMGKTGEDKGDKDKLVFKKGTFVSTACVQYGFNDAPYSVIESDGVTTFTASPTNEKGETMSWTGTVRDGVLEGTAVYKTSSGETTYWFKGKLGAAEASMKEHPKKAEHPEHPK